MSKKYLSRFKLGHSHFLAAAIVVSLLFSIYLLSVAYSKPEMHKSEKIVLSLHERGVYSYDAVLKPNFLYGARVQNRSEGLFFSSIIDTLKLRYTYTFVANYSTDATTLYTMEAFLVSKSPSKEESALWQKSLPLGANEKILLLSPSASFTKEYSVNVSEMLNLTRTIEKEINVRGDTYLLLSSNVYIKTDFLEDRLTQVMTVKLDSILGFEGEAANSTKNFTRVDEEPAVVSIFGVNTTVSNAKRVSLGMLAVPLLLSTYGAYRFILTNRRVQKTSSKADSINRKYRNWIIKTECSDLMLEGGICVKSIEDMVRLSEDLGKPVMYLKKENTHIYYILDNNIKYVFALDEAFPQYP